MNKYSSTLHPSYALLVLLVLACTVSNEVFSVISLALILVALVLKKTIVKAPFSMCLPLFALVLIGVVSGTASQNSVYDILKDIWYFSKPIIFLALGYYIGRKITSQKIAMTLIFLGVVIAVKHIYSLSTAPAYQYADTLDQFRSLNGRGEYTTALALAMIMFFYPRLGLGWGGKLLVIISLGLIMYSTYMSYSRTIWISFVIMWALTSGGEKGSFQTVAFKAFLVVLAVVGCFWVADVFSLGGGRVLELIGKFKEIFVETQIQSYITEKEINENWRGYESAQALNQYVGLALPQMLFGSGYGTLVGLGLYINLDGYFTNTAPIIHNGFLYVLIKCGAVGLALYLYFMYSLLRVSLAAYKLSMRINVAGGVDVFFLRIPLALTLIFILSSFTVSGIFNKGSITILIILMGTSLMRFNFIGSKVR